MPCHIATAHVQEGVGSVQLPTCSEFGLIVDDGYCPHRADAVKPAPHESRGSGA